MPFNYEHIFLGRSVPQLRSPDHPQQLFVQLVFWFLFHPLLPSSSIFFHLLPSSSIFFHRISRYMYIPLLGFKIGLKIVIFESLALLIHYFTIPIASGIKFWPSFNPTMVKTTPWGSVCEDFCILVSIGSLMSEIWLPNYLSNRLYMGLGRFPEAFLAIRRRLGTVRNRLGAIRNRLGTARNRLGATGND